MVRQTFYSTNTNRQDWNERKRKQNYFKMAAKFKREKVIYHHGPKHIPIICHLPDPPSF